MNSKGCEPEKCHEKGAMKNNTHYLLINIILLFVFCISPINSQALEATIIDQPTRPVGVSLDLDGNVFVISDAISTTLLTRYGIDGTKQYITLGGIDPTFFSTAHLALDPKNGFIYLLSPIGQIYAVNPQTMAVQPFLDFSIPPFEVVEDAYDIIHQRFFRFAFIQPIYGDIAVYRINDTLFDIFISGRTRLSPPSLDNPPLVGPVYFVMRLRVDENALRYTPKVVAWGQFGGSLGIGGGYPNPAGIAVNNNGTVLTTLPALAGITGNTYMTLASFKYDFPENRMQSNLPYYVFLNNSGLPMDFWADGMSSGPDGRFYLATTPVGSSECGAGGGGSLIMVSRDLNSFLCIPSNIILNWASDISINKNNNIFLTNYNPGLLLKFNAITFNTYTPLAGLSANDQIYYTLNFSAWTHIPGQLSQLQVGDLNGDGQADLAGLTSAGKIYYTTNRKTWVNIPGTLAQLAVGDLNGDGQADLAGLTGDGRIYYTLNRATWVNIPGRLSRLVTGDFNNDGHADLAGLTDAGRIYYTLDRATWVNIPGRLSRLVTGDFNDDGRDDLAGLTDDGRIYYTLNRSTWVNIPGYLSRLVAGDLDGDGQADLAGLAGDGTVWYTTSFSSWTRIPGQLSRLVAGDFNDDGRDDLAGLAGNGTVWYTINLGTWKNIPGQLYRLAGDPD